MTKDTPWQATDRPEVKPWGWGDSLSLVVRYPETKHLTKVGLTLIDSLTPNLVKYIGQMN